MYQNMSKATKGLQVSGEEAEELNDLLCTTFANMAQCFYQT